MYTSPSRAIVQRCVVKEVRSIITGPEERASIDLGTNFHTREAQLGCVTPSWRTAGRGRPDAPGSRRLSVRRSRQRLGRAARGPRSAHRCPSRRPLWSRQYVHCGKQCVWLGAYPLLRLLKVHDLGARSPVAKLLTRLTFQNTITATSISGRATRSLANWYSWPLSWYRTVQPPPASYATTRSNQSGEASGPVGQSAACASRNPASSTASSGETPWTKVKQLATAIGAPRREYQSSHRSRQHRYPHHRRSHEDHGIEQFDDRSNGQRATRWSCRTWLRRSIGVQLFLSGGHPGVRVGMVSRHCRQRGDFLFVQAMTPPAIQPTPMITAASTKGTTSER
jgi:hypothetical protein